MQCLTCVNVDGVSGLMDSYTSPTVCAVQCVRLGAQSGTWRLMHDVDPFQVTDLGRLCLTTPRVGSLTSSVHP